MFHQIQLHLKASVENLLPVGSDVGVVTLDDGHGRDGAAVLQDLSDDRRRGGKTLGQPETFNAGLFV